MLALEAEGWDIRGTVHDEIICTEPIDGRGWQEMAEVMGRELPWAKGLLLKAAGYECPYYMKDD
jgi:DNA polymerase bacteriophage-type